jgi:integrase
LKLWFEFLDRRDLGWAEVQVDDVARFVVWLRAPAVNVIVLDAGTALRSPATVNRHLAAVFGFYEFHARSGVEVAAGLVARRRIGRGSYKPFPHHVTAGRPIATRPVKLTVPRRAPRTLTAEEVVIVLAAPARARDRFLLALLAETGMRIGQALGLRHADFVSRAKEVRIVPRADNANGARAKLRSSATVPVTAGLVRCYSDYMHTEYGDVDSDYVFVNLWAGRIGAPMTYASVYELVSRLKASTGVDFTLHMLRHTHATELIRSGVAIEVVARLLTHQSSTTTSQIYVHLDATDVREALHRAGVWDRAEPAS